MVVGKRSATGSAEGGLAGLEQVQGGFWGAAREMAGRNRGMGHREGRAGQMWVGWPARQELEMGHEVRVADAPGMQAEVVRWMWRSRDGCRVQVDGQVGGKQDES